MIVIQESLQLSAKESQTNIKFPFHLDKDYRLLQISFSYGPSHSRDQSARDQVKAAIEAYIPDHAPAIEKDVESYLPVENFITISMSKEGQYIGNYHNKKKNQVIKISEDEASLGFWATSIPSGTYEVQLNCHCIASENLYLELKVEVFP